MTYSLNTLNTPRKDAPKASRSVLGRFAQELWLLVGLVALALWLLALLSYSPLDPAWSTSGNGGPLHNYAGYVGAWLADSSYFLFGFSVWWAVAAAMRAWLSALARWLRGHDDTVAPVQSINAHWSIGHGRGVFWLGLLLLLCASAMLEWTRFYSLRPTCRATAAACWVISWDPWG